MRTIAIGDIHGCDKALATLLDAIQPTETDRLIFLGDYVDRGADSKSVIDRLLALKRRCQPVFLLGNHEIMLRSVLSGPVPEFWLQLGGKETVASYGGCLANVPLTHIDFLMNLLPYYETSSAIFVHACYDETLPMSQQEEQTLYWEHISDGVPGPHCSGKHVYLGHTPQLTGEVGRFAHVTCLDTYCFGGGWLTGLDVETGNIWQSSANGQLRVSQLLESGGFLGRLWRKLAGAQTQQRSRPHLNAENELKASNLR